MKQILLCGLFRHTHPEDIRFAVQIHSCVRPVICTIKFYFILFVYVSYFSGILVRIAAKLEKSACRQAYHFSYSQEEFCSLGLGMGFLPPPKPWVDVLRQYGY